MSSPMRLRPTIVAVLALAVLCNLSQAAENPSERARALVSRGALDSAMAVADSILAADSANPDMWLIKSEVHAARSDHAAEIRELRAILARYPKFPDALIALVKAYLDSGVVDSAATYLKPHLFFGKHNKRKVLYLKGRVLELRGQPDSAIAVYREAYIFRDRQVLLRFPPLRQQQINHARFASADGTPGIWGVGVPTIFLFWAGWSPVSVDALGEIVENLKGAGITWRFVPVNVDAPKPNRTSATHIVNRARELGYKDTVWVDPDLALFRQWGIDHVPTTIVVNINGEIDAVLSGWSTQARSVIIDQYLGSYTDSVSEAVSTASEERKRARYLLASAFQAGDNGNLEQAVKRSDKAIIADTTFPLAYVCLAAWRWLRGDTVGARIAAHQAIAVDPNDLWAMMAVGRIDYMHGQYQSAFDFARQCTVLDSEFVPAWELLGHSALALGDTQSADRAIDVITRFNKLDLELPVLRAGAMAATDPEGAAELLRRNIAADF